MGVSALNFQGTYRSDLLRSPLLCLTWRAFRAAPCMAPLCPALRGVNATFVLFVPLFLALPSIGVCTEVGSQNGPGPEQMTHGRWSVPRRAKRCTVDGCTTRPSFGCAGGTALFCAKHRTPDHIDLVNLRCTDPGCLKTASFGGSDTSWARVKCGQHRAPLHVDVLHRRDTYERNCLAGAIWTRAAAATETELCEGLGVRARAERMRPPPPGVTFPQRRRRAQAGAQRRAADAPTCRYPGGCFRPATYCVLRPGPDGGTRGAPRAPAVACREHRDASHVSVARSECAEPGCARTAVYGWRRGAAAPGAGRAAGRALRCARHREGGQVDLKHGACDTPGCGAAASFGALGAPPSRCALHRGPAHVAPRERGAALARWLRALPPRERARWRAALKVPGDAPDWAAVERDMLVRGVLPFSRATRGYRQARGRAGEADGSAARRGAGGGAAERGAAEGHGSARPGARIEALGVVFPDTPESALRDAAPALALAIELGLIPATEPLAL